MSKKQAALDTILGQGVLPLYFYPDAAVSIDVLRTLYKAGIRAVEYTNRGEAALDNFRQMLAVRDAELPGMLLGIGTIKTAAQAIAFIEAGADYLISPGTLPEVAAEANKAGLLWVPGCMTTTEVIVAENLGCTFVKLFPGNLLGPSYVSAIFDLFPGVKFMPTGGVEVEEGNLSAWFKSGVSAVGLGSKLISKSVLESRDYDTIAVQTAKALELVNAIR
jgi:2-dehydro-3-deoxyphosphogluconate aldolase/(4S)-4-hydroxy-2-oxoglutarate aldolase